MEKFLPFQEHVASLLSVRFRERRQSRNRKWTLPLLETILSSRNTASITVLCGEWFREKIDDNASESIIAMSNACCSVFILRSLKSFDLAQIKTYRSI